MGAVDRLTPYLPRKITYGTNALARPERPYRKEEDILGARTSVARLLELALVDLAASPR